MAVVVAGCASPPPDSEALVVSSVNTCAASCAEYGAGVRCQPIAGTDRCVSLANLDYTLIASLPVSSYAPNRDVVIDSKSVIGSEFLQLGRISKKNGFAVLKDESALSATLINSKPKVGGTTRAAIPMQATFIPHVRVPSGGNVPAAIAAYPVPTMKATTVLTVDPSGPYAGSEVIGYAMNNLIVGERYRCYLKPVDQFAQFIPPVLSEAFDIRDVGSGVIPEPVEIDIESRIYRVFGAGFSLEDWEACIYDKSTGVPVSTTASVRKNEASLVRHVPRQTPSHAFRPPSHDSSLKLSPPASVQGGVPIPRPTLTRPLIGALTISYPRVPDPVSVSGVVVEYMTDTEVPVPVAEPIILEFRSDRGPHLRDGLLEYRDDSTLTSSEDLTYRTSVTTGPNGSYEVVLPPGTYRVNFRAVDRSKRGRGSIGPALFRVGDTPSVQKGKTLSIQSLVTIQGTVNTASGASLAGAHVEARPAAANAVINDPTMWLPDVAIDQTDANGVFRLHVDPNEAYDIFIRPPSGSGLAWRVLPKVKVPWTSERDNRVVHLRREALQLPAPVSIGRTLRDPDMKPIRLALVKAYVTPTGGDTVVQVGEARTDQDGYYELLIAPLLPADQPIFKPTWK